MTSVTGDATKTRILMAAGPIFAEKGRRDATVREICNAAGVNIASVNYYFQDKDNLYLEAVRFARKSQASKYPFPQWDGDHPPKQKLHEFVTTMLNRLVALQDAPWQVRLMMNEVLQPTEVCQDLVESYFRPVFSMLLEIVRDIVKEDLPEETLKKIGFSIIGQCIFYRYSSHVVSLFIAEDSAGAFEMKPLADHISNFCITALENGHWKNSSAAPRTKSSESIITT